MLTLQIALGIVLGLAAWTLICGLVSPWLAKFVLERSFKGLEAWSQSSEDSVTK